MNINKDQQYQQNMKKKFNQGQHIRKVQYFKKKHRRAHMQTKKTIPENNQFQSPDTIQIAEFQKLSISEQSSVLEKKYNRFDTGSNTDPTLLLSDYSMISETNFKEMLLTSTSPEDIDTNALIELLNNEQIFIFTRQLTQLINKLNYFKLQNEQWTYYYNLGMREGIWTGRVSKKMANANSMCHTYGRSKILIEQRQLKYKQQLEQIQNEINEYMTQAPTLLAITKIMNIINNFIYKDQYQLRIELQRRRTMLQFDAKEHQLVHDLYKLKPRKTEIHSAKIIWKAIHDEQTFRYEIAIFKKWLSIPSLQTSYTFRDFQLMNINHIFTELVFKTQQISTYDLALQTLSKAEDMAQTYAQRAVAEKNKLLHTRCHHKNILIFDQIVAIIISRENNIIQRAQYGIEQKVLTILNPIQHPFIKN